jgi:hypothetical protein
MFVLANWAMCLITTAALLGIIRFQRFLVVKPSLQLAGWHHLCVQWGATFRSPMVEALLPDPWTFTLLVHGFPLIVLACTLFTGRRSARLIYQRLRSGRRYSVPMLVLMTGITSGMTAAFFLYYVVELGLSQTGMYALLADPLKADLAREHALKLVENPLIRYGYALAASTSAPLAAGALGGLLALCVIHRKPFSAGFFLLILAALTGLVSLSGARSYAAVLLLTLVLAYLIGRGLRMRPLTVGCGFLAVFLIPTVITLIREDQRISVPLVWEYYGAIFERAFITPMNIGLFYVYHAQVGGFFGIAAMPKLAWLSGVAPVDAANVIGLEYVSTSVESISAGASFVFTYYSYFGLGAFPVCCVAVLALDLAVPVYGRLNNTLLPVCVAAVAACMLAFTAADLTTALITHGFLPILCLGSLLDRILRRWAPDDSERLSPGAEGPPLPSP